MTSVDCMNFGIVLIVLGLMFGIASVFASKKTITQEKFINFGGTLVGIGTIISTLSIIYFFLSIMLL